MLARTHHTQTRTLANVHSIRARASKQSGLALDRAASVYLGKHNLVPHGVIAVVALQPELLGFKRASEDSSFGAPILCRARHHLVINAVQQPVETHADIRMLTRERCYVNTGLC